MLTVSYLQKIVMLIIFIPLWLWMDDRNGIRSVKTQATYRKFVVWNKWGRKQGELDNQVHLEKWPLEWSRWDVAI